MFGKLQMKSGKKHMMQIPLDIVPYIIYQALDLTCLNVAPDILELNYSGSLNRTNLFYGQTRTVQI